MRGLERELDRLFGLPLDDFTAARNELARRLKADGQAESAAQVRALAKPSVPTWAINQLSRREPGAIGALVDAGDALRKAQQRLLQGAGTADSLRAAGANEREAVQLLTERARAVLENAGRSATAAMLERITQTLQAAAVDDEGRRSLKAGRLIGEMKSAGFETLGGLKLPAGQQRRPSAPDELAQRRQEKEGRRRRRRELEQKVRELERSARAAARDADRAADAAADARRLAESARAAVEEAAAELAEL